MKTVKLDQATIATLLEGLLKRNPSSYGDYETTVARILLDVREKKDPTLRNSTTL